jgi:4-hydroxy-3-methylbut-2-enyl diphosphate reductase
MVVENIDDIPQDSYLILRSHGVPPELERKARLKNLKPIDTTCPNVKKVQNLAKELLDNHYFVVIIGQAKHPEVIGILARLNNKKTLVLEKDIEYSALINKDKIGVVMQTTQSKENVKRIINQLLSNHKIKELKIYNTLCEEVIKRMEDTEKLAKQVDMMLVVGGKNSANTTRLKELAKRYCKSVYHIEEKSQLKRDWFIDKQIIGITAGTSTPTWIVDEIIQSLQKV